MECEFAKSERFGEEEAKLQHGTKKVKEDQTLGSSQANLDGCVGAGGTLSYKAKLVGDIPDAYAQAFKIHADEEKEPISNEGLDDPP